MARIVYKKGLEGQNKLECIEGIEIGMSNGQYALIYPKYEDLPLLYNRSINEWKAKSMTQIKALNVEETIEETDELLTLNSPAAEFVRKFKSDIHGNFNMPTVLAAMEIVRQLKEINNLAETIEGAELLRKDVIVSGCFRSYRRSRWVAYGSAGFTGYYDLSSSNAGCVPTIVYKKPQTVYMVTSERAEREDSQYLIDETKLFASFDDAKEYARHKFEKVLKIFGLTKDDVKVQEAEKENSEEVYFIQSNFIYHYSEWDVWVSIEKKEIE